MPEMDASNQVAIVGMACRFPGASNLDEFWKLLVEGREGITHFSEEALLESGVPPEYLADPDYVRAYGLIDAFDRFDAPFFGYTPHEALTMDPQQRLFLELCWHAIEHAGYDPSSLDVPVGVFAGRGTNAYRLKNLNTHPDLFGKSEGLQALIGNDADYLSTRVAYKLNLRGPALTVQTACSTSLVAAHYACQSLLNGECDLALAGGVSIDQLERRGYFYFEGGTHSADGHTRTFDETGTGMVPANGAGVVLLKPLADALADGDTIYAVILGSAVNNDGEDKIGFTAPSVTGQASVILEAQAVSGVHPDEISYIEAHGTATRLGDPIELDALRQSFSLKTNRTGFCAIGSVKSNIGHTISAAGVAGLIKTALSLHHGQIPPSLFFQKPNPEIDFQSGPFYVNDALKNWEKGDSPRIAGVSSFGIGGTNAHMLVMESPSRPASSFPEPDKAQILPISHRDPAGTVEIGEALAGHLAGNPDQVFADVAFTLQKGRRAQPFRTFVVAADHSEAVENLKRLPAAQKAAPDMPVAFLLPGQGSEYIGMGRSLFETEPRFREILEQGARILESLLGENILKIIYPDGDENTSEKLACPVVAHPWIFLVSYAMAKTLEPYGLAPAGILGHSMGEYAAATLAGVFRFEDALVMVARRAQLVETTDPGAMLAIQMPEDEVRSMLLEGVDLALVNGPNDVVVSGPERNILDFAEILAGQERPYSRMHAEYGFHSALMEPIQDKFEAILAEMPLSAPAIPFISNLTGDWIDPADAVDPAYWARQLRGTAQLSAGMGRLIDQGFLLLGVGPSTVLTSLARRRKAPYAISTMRRPNQKISDKEALLQALGQLWSAGVPIDWDILHTGREPRRVPLPQYPFARNRYWIEELKQPIFAQAAAVKRTNTDDWLYTPTWQRSQNRVLPDLARKEGENWLVFASPRGIGSRLIDHLKALKQHVITVYPSSAHVPAGPHFEVNPAKPADFDYVFENTGGNFSMIVFAWDFENAEESFFSLVHLSKAIEKYVPNRSLRLAVITTDLYEIWGEEHLRPVQALTLGPLRVIPFEQENVATIGIDLSGEESSRTGGELLDALMADILDARRLDHGKRIVAYRRGIRWQQVYEPVLLPDKSERPQIRRNGTYLITGGFGGIGLVLAKRLTELNGANLAIVSRTALPRRSEWDAWLGSHPEDDPVSRKIAALRELELAGAKTRAFSADVTDKNAMSGVLNDIERLYGPLHGVIHSAGIAGGGMIQLKSRQEAEAVLAPKVQGTMVLGELLQDVPLDFFILCSSMMSIFGDFGQVDYTAANAFLDSFAAWNTRRGQHTVSVNWDYWQEVGMAVETEVPESMQAQRRADLQTGINNAEARRVFDRILASRLSQILVSTRDLDLRLKPAANAEAGEAFAVEEMGSTEPAAYSRRDLTSEFVPPATETEKMVTEIWQQLFGHEKIGIRDDFFELGGHSLMAIRMFAQVKERSGKKLPLTSLYDFPTIEKLSQRLVREEKEIWPTIVDMHPEGSAPPFFCVHGFGGGVLGYTDLAKLLGEEQPFYGLRARGMDGVEEPHQEIEEMAAYYIDALRKVQPKGPYFLGGYCFGGVVAFEMAKQLKAAGEEAPLIAIFEGYAPIEDSVRIKWWHPKAVFNFLQNATFWFKDFMKMGFRPMLARGIWILRTRFAGRLKRSQEGPDEVNLEDIIEDVSGIPQEHQRLMEIHIRALTRYHPSPTDAKAHLFRVRGQSLFGSYDKDNGWGNLAKGGVDIHFIEGAHRNILEKPHVESLAVQLRDALKNANKENRNTYESRNGR